MGAGRGSASSGNGRQRQWPVLPLYLFGAFHQPVGVVRSWPVCGRSPWDSCRPLSRVDDPHGSCPWAASKELV